MRHPGILEPRDIEESILCNMIYVVTEISLITKAVQAYDLFHIVSCIIVIIAPLLLLL